MNLTKICTPATFYLLISLISLFIYVSCFRKIYTQRYHIIIHILAIFIWSYILNIICDINYGITISWILVLTPIILAFMIVSQVQYDDLNEGYCNDTTKEFLVSIILNRFNNKKIDFIEVLNLLNIL